MTTNPFKETADIMAEMVRKLEKIKSCPLCNQKPRFNEDEFVLNSDGTKSYLKMYDEQINHVYIGCRNEGHRVEVLAATVDEAINKWDRRF